VRWTATVNEWDRLKDATANLDMRASLYQPKCWNPMPRCSPPIKCVLPTTKKFDAGLRSSANLHHRILCIGIGAQLINASSVIHVNVCDQRAVKALQSNAKRLLPKIHTWINDHSARRIRPPVTPLQEKRAAQALVACIL
jgi:hypothetical protein